MSTKCSCGDCASCHGQEMLAALREGDWDRGIRESLAAGEAQARALRATTRTAAEKAPDSPSLIALIKDGPTPHVFEPSEPRVVVRDPNAKPPERMPPPVSMAELYRKEAKP